jgi:hypothetical protein
MMVCVWPSCYWLFRTPLYTIIFHFFDAIMQFLHLHFTFPSRNILQQPTTVAGDFALHHFSF